MARKPDKKQLFNIELNELSLVDDPANAEAMVTLFKRADGAQLKEAKKMAEENNAVVELTKKLTEAVSKMEDVVTTNADLQKQLDVAYASIVTLKAEHADGKKKNPFADKAEDGDDNADDVMKGLDAKTAAIVKSALAKAEAAEAGLHKMQEERLEAAFITKAGELKYLPIEATELGPILKRLSLGTVGKTDFDTINKMLAGVNEVMKQSEIFKTLGSGLAPALMKSGAESQLDAKALELMKSNTALTREGAFAKAMDMHPELYAQYIQETTVN